MIERISKMFRCPYCNSKNDVGISQPFTSFTAKWDIEQLAYCKDCQREFIYTYKVYKTLPIEESTIFEDSESPQQSRYTLKKG